MQYQWYPGHMTKAKRMMQENIKLIDLVIELLDARAPQSARNPDIDTLAQGKSRLALLNKADLADPQKTVLWEAHFLGKGILAVPIDARSRAGMKEIQAAVAKVCEEKIARDRKRGILNRPVRAMVAGIPNVGKSTFINSFAGKACAKTGNKPGVTKGKQWIRLNKNVELLDTPGILWPKFEDQTTGEHLAFLGSLNDETIEIEELALRLLAFLQTAYPAAVPDHYAVDASGREPIAVLEEIAVRRGCIGKGAQPDLYKASQRLLDDFRGGRLGRITLEIPQAE